MALKNNFLKYSGLTFNDILTQINNKLNSDSRFANFRESAIAQMISEIFAGTTDLINYYIERRAEECFFDTAQLKSSVILLARSLGYVIKRSVPAEAKIKLIINGNSSIFQNVNVGDKIQIPYHRVFAYKGKKYILKNGLVYTLKLSDIVNLLTDNYQLEISVDDYENNIVIVQGEIKEQVIEGNNNIQIGQKFQIYKIEDSGFSNIYGSDDFTVPVTKIWVGDDKTDDNLYIIDRRSLINWESINSFGVDDVVKLCVVRTSLDENVEILFGDSQFAAMGATIRTSSPRTIYDNIYVQYLNTDGSKSNQVGIIGDKLTFGDKVFINNLDITSQVDFKFVTNITGGADLEDIDSIKMNAPEIYYSLDRLVTKRDYRAYLKSLTSPMNVKNAIAWGEQDEIEKSENIKSILDLYNVVFFSVVGSLYNIDKGNKVSVYSSKTINNGLYEVVLDNDYDEYRYTDQSFYNIYVGTSSGANIAKIIKNYESINTSAYYHQIRGSDIILSAGYDTIVQDQNNVKINVNYGSLKTGYASNFYDTKEVVIDLNGVTTVSMIGDRLQSQLSAMVDDRPNNNNLGLAAFPGINVWYVGNEISGNFYLSGLSTDICYINNLTDVSTNKNFLNQCGLLKPFAEYKFLYTANNRYISKGIKDVIDLVDARCQVTVRNVYVTPIIQTFNIVGTVYLNQLEDKTELATKIHNDIYKYADVYLDFNTPLYKSKIMEIIQSYPNVIGVNINFEPSLDALPIGKNNYWIPYEDARIDNDINKNNIYSVILNALSDYLSVSEYNYSARDVWNNTSFYQNLFSQSLSYYNNVTERTFYQNFVKVVYNNLKDLGINFRDTDNFREVMADIRKDLLWLIKYNMMDSQGNIGIQENNTSNNRIRGGFSIGSEIIKLNSKIVYQYKI
jgi:uncharacterized phage protein gp47/JayE